ncbi:lipid A deacylase LpxR family protein [Flavobacterium rhizosphaerae]|uniref:Lipid A deacylase LpxR family protein n=1 Tax=Flavobacterium rhizosphaerae TaxID=3163298 RepID=A0ABW8Z061_9FLAO
MIRFCVIIAFFAYCPVFAQHVSEIGLVSDNDSYTSFYNDQYYTNGIEIFYRTLGTPRAEDVAKVVNEFKIGQYIYNPQSVRAREIEVHDRPFAGYLFAEAGINTFFKNESVLKVAFQAGVVGPESYARQFQEGLHKVLGLHTVHGWNYQITTTPALQSRIFYSHKILPKRYHEKTDFYLQGEVNAGTIWLSASVGAMVRLSLKDNLLPIYESALHNATLTANKDVYAHREELFIYFNPNLQYMGFDATIQGSPFNNDSPVTFPLIPLRFNAEAGIKYARKRWNYGFSFNYRGKELSNNVITGFYYGSVKLGYILF